MTQIQWFCSSAQPIAWDLIINLDSCFIGQNLHPAYLSFCSLRPASQHRRRMPGLRERRAAGSWPGVENEKPRIRPSCLPLGLAPALLIFPSKKIIIIRRRAAACAARRYGGIRGATRLHRGAFFILTLVLPGRSAPPAFFYLLITA